MICCNSFRQKECRPYEKICDEPAKFKLENITPQPNATRTCFYLIGRNTSHSPDFATIVPVDVLTCMLLTKHNAVSTYPLDLCRSQGLLSPRTQFHVSSGRVSHCRVSRCHELSFTPPHLLFHSYIPLQLRSPQSLCHWWIALKTYDVHSDVRRTIILYFLITDSYLRTITFKQGVNSLDLASPINSVHQSCSPSAGEVAV